MRAARRMATPPNGRRPLADPEYLEEGSQALTPETDSRDGPEPGVSLLEQQLSDIMDEVPAGVIEEISARDHMFNTGWSHYFLIAWGALDCIRRAMHCAYKSSADSILDLPSGHGRVLRMLKAEFPHAKLTASDIDRDAVDFCAETFGAVPIYSTADPSQLEIEDRFDLIWSGSLLTHLDQKEWIAFLDLFEALLVENGLLVFTTHGRRIIERLQDPEDRWVYAETQDQVDTMLSGYARDGFGFFNYSFPEGELEKLSLPEQGFGTSLSSPSWVCAQIERRPSLEIVAFMEGRWGAQDVIACTKKPTG
jgi:SAM-dependent methyltransferase